MTASDLSPMERLLADAEQLAELGSWELDLRDGSATWSDGLYRIHGLRPGSVQPGVAMLLDVVHADDRARIAALLSTVVEHPGDIPPEGIETEYRARRPDGTLREIRFRGRVERDASGRHARWVGAAQDVTEQRLTERELQAHYAVGQALRDWESFDEGVNDLLRRLGTALEARFGALWTWDADRERLTSRAFWDAVADEDPTAFEQATRAMSFAPGEGGPGLAWEQQRPIVMSDVATQPRFDRPRAAQAAAVASGLAFPALHHGGPLAVLSFYTPDRRALSPRLERTMTGIGRELGRFLNRRRGHLESRILSPRELEVLQLASAGHSGPVIAGMLGVSPHTVKTHFENIYEKLGTGDRGGAVAHALRTGLIE